MAFILEHLGKSIQTPIVKNRSVSVSILSLMLFHYHLPLAQITNHHSSLNQLASNEMRGFVQRVPLLIALYLSNSLVDITQINIPTRFFLTFVALRPDFIQLPIIPLTTFRPTDVIETVLFIDAGCQRLDSQIKGYHLTFLLLVFFDAIAERSVVIASAIPANRHFSKAFGGISVSPASIV